MPSAVERAIDRIYEAPLSEFVEVRAAAAKELREAGQTDAAKELAKIPKPTVAVWALNQIARTKPEDVERLLEAGRALRRAQLRALEGERMHEEFSSATDEQRRAIGALANAIPPLLEEHGHAASSTTIDQARSLLRAAAVDERLGRLFQAGRLARGVEEPAFEDLTAELSAALEAAPKRARVDAARRREEEREAKARERAAKAEERERAKQERERADEERARARAEERERAAEERERGRREKERVAKAARARAAAGKARTEDERRRALRAAAAERKEAARREIETLRARVTELRAEAKERASALARAEAVWRRAEKAVEAARAGVEETQEVIDRVNEKIEQLTRSARAAG